jgi:hypothetical protein
VPTSRCAHNIVRAAVLLQLLSISPLVCGVIRGQLFTYLLGTIYTGALPVFMLNLLSGLRLLARHLTLAQRSTAGALSSSALFQAHSMSASCTSQRLVRRGEGSAQRCVYTCCSCSSALHSLRMVSCEVSDDGDCLHHHIVQ